MRQVSKKQARKNRILSGIKLLLPKRCHFCGMNGTDLMHILPRSLFAEYMCEEWNLTIGCRNCHNDFDGDRQYRQRQTDLFRRVMDRVDEKDKGMVRKYFDIWE